MAYRQLASRGTFIVTLTSAAAAALFAACGDDETSASPGLPDATDYVADAAKDTSTDTISAEEMRNALLASPGQRADDILHRPLGDGLILPELLEQVARHYLKRAMEETDGNKTEAAKLVGLPSYQTLTNWLDRYKVPT